MKDVTVAARYARALFIVTENRRETIAALPDLKGMAVALAPTTHAGELLRTPQVLLSDKRQALRQALEGKVLHSVLLFIDLLLRKKRINELDLIAREFEAIVEKQQGIQRAHVVSAAGMTDEETARLHSELERHTHSKIKLTAEVDPALVGGALVRIGDHVIDRSVRTLLDQIERQLAEVSV